MKKLKTLIAIAFATIFAISAMSCGSSTINSQNIVSPVPWALTENAALAYEKSVYEVKKYNGDATTVIGNGRLVFELDSYGRIDDIDYSSLTMNFSITYNDFAQENDKGKTDTITSTVIFSSAQLAPYSSTKTVTVADRDDAVNNSYSLSVDYANKKSTLDWTKKDAEQSVIDFSGQNTTKLLDNEQLFYAVRAFDTLQAGAQMYPFTIANFFDMHVYYDAYHPYEMIFNCDEKTESMSFPASTHPTVNSYLSDAQGNVNALTTTVQINASESGTPITVKYSMTDFNAGSNQTTERVMLFFSTYEQDYNTAKITTITNYSLSEYYTSK